MKVQAVAYNQHGGPEVFEDLEVELPDAPPAGHVRVRADAVALNHLDLWFRRGLPHLKLAFPMRLGSDIAGTITALGPGVDGPPVGTEVVVAPGVSCGRCEFCQAGEDNMCRDFKVFGEFIPGGYTELVDVPVGNLFPKSPKISMTDAASLPIAFLTAWALVIQKGQARLGETMLVHAAGSGVTTAAIQIAARSGVRVIATTSSSEKVERAMALGASAVIDTSKADFSEEVKRLTGKQGVDLAIDHCGGELFTKTIALLKMGGRIVSCGATAGPPPKVDVTRMYMRYNTLLGTRMGPKRAMPWVLRQIEAGTLRPVVDKVLPLTVDGVREAHKLLESRQVFGKIVLQRPS